MAADDLEGGDGGFAHLVARQERADGATVPGKVVALVGLDLWPRVDFS